MPIEITIDLEVTAASLKANCEKWVRVLPDELLLMGLDHYADEEGITEQDANDLVRAGLKAMLIRAHREERDRRLESNVPPVG
jgi:hypothetical protein